MTRAAQVRGWSSTTRSWVTRWGRSRRFGPTCSPELARSIGSGSLFPLTSALAITPTPSTSPATPSHGSWTECHTARNPLITTATCEALPSRTLSGSSSLCGARARVSRAKASRSSRMHLASWTTTPTPSLCLPASSGMRHREAHPRLRQATEPRPPNVRSGPLLGRAAATVSAALRAILASRKIPIMPNAGSRVALGSMTTTCQSTRPRGVVPFLHPHRVSHRCRLQALQHRHRLRPLRQNQRRISHRFRLQALQQRLRLRPFQQNPRHAQTDQALGRAASTAGAARTAPRASRRTLTTRSAGPRASQACTRTTFHNIGPHGVAQPFQRHRRRSHPQQPQTLKKTLQLVQVDWVFGRAASTASAAEMAPHALRRTPTMPSAGHRALLGSIPRTCPSTRHHGAAACCRLQHGGWARSF